MLLTGLCKFSRKILKVQLSARVINFAEDYGNLHLFDYFCKLIILFFR